MSLTMKDLDRIYGTPELEVFRISRMSLWNEHPGTLLFLHDHTCVECKERLSNRWRLVARRRRSLSGRVEMSKELVTPRGFFLYFRARGTESRLIKEARFIHVSCLAEQRIKIADLVEMGPNWIPHGQGVPA